MAIETKNMKKSEENEKMRKIKLKNQSIKKIGRNALKNRNSNFVVN